MTGLASNEAGPRLATIADAAARIAAAGKLLVTCHRGPDGDGVGSMVALAALARAQGKKVTLYCPDPVPRRLKWMPLARGFVRALKGSARFPVTVVVDCADPRLLGSAFPGREVTGELIALDHHASVVPFGDLFVCDPQAASVGVLVARIARHLGWPLTREAAIGLYTSLVSDTGSFSFSNTNAEALELASELVALGVDPGLVTEHLSERYSLGRYRLLSTALGTLELRLEGKVAFMTITHEMVKAAGATWDDTIDLVSYTRAIDGVACGVLFTPAKHGGVRVSMRAKRSVDASKVCEALGGGGHRGAAGCVLAEGMEAARVRVEAALAHALGMELTAPAVPQPTTPADPQPEIEPDEDQRDSE